MAKTPHCVKKVEKASFPSYFAVRVVVQRSSASSNTQQQPHQLHQLELKTLQTRYQREPLCSRGVHCSCCTGKAASSLNRSAFRRYAPVSCSVAICEARGANESKTLETIVHLSLCALQQLSILLQSSLTPGNPPRNGEEAF